MRCRRCRGLLVKDRLYDLYDTQLHTEAWRCIACGDLLDPVILRNRAGQSDNVKVTIQTEPALQSLNFKGSLQARG